jgi:hypothetical protein
MLHLEGANENENEVVRYDGSRYDYGESYFAACHAVHSVCLHVLPDVYSGLHSHPDSHPGGRCDWIPDVLSHESMVADKQK